MLALRLAIGSLSAGLAISAAGCGMPTLSSGLRGGIFDSSKPQPQPPQQPQQTAGGWSTQVTEATMLTAAQTGGAAAEPGASLECPVIAAAQLDKVITVYDQARLNDNQFVMHRGEITKTARECQVFSNTVSVKYGVAGRVILGPKAKPGIITLPAMLTVTDPAKAKVRTVPMKIQVQVSMEEPVGFFSIVGQIDIPVSPGALAKDYRLSVAFEKKGAGVS
jgi:hypothetical protein